MPLIEQIITDKIEIVGPFKHIQVREDLQIIDDVTGEVRSGGNFRRHVLAPGDDVSGEGADIQAIAAVLWTPAITEAWRKHMAGLGDTDAVADYVPPELI